MTKIRLINKKQNGVAIFEISAENLRVIVTNLGCHLISMYAKDRHGKEEDVILGLENIDDYVIDESYMGAVVGRVANRIGNAKFNLNGQTYNLKANNGRNHLHGGNEGFDKKVFEYEIKNDGIKFSYNSSDMEEGYPGNLLMEVEYKVENNTLTAVYTGSSDKDTIVNITNHAYFNLTGCKEKIYNHKLKISACEVACADESCLANGEFMNVAGTAFDFREFHEIGERINNNEEQLIHACGYDHSFIFNKTENQVVLYEPKSGRKLTVSTSLPAMQLYTGNFLAGGCKGKGGEPYENRDGVALETQYLPNSINIEKDSKVILKKGQRYNAVTSYRFEVE